MGVGGRLDRAREEAEELDRRGYLPPLEPMTRTEHERIVSERGLSRLMAQMLWDVLGRGVPISTAHHWASKGTGADSQQRYRNHRRRLQRIIRDIGWSEKPE